MNEVFMSVSDHKIQPEVIRQTKKVWDLTGAVLEVMRCLSIQIL